MHALVIGSAPAPPEFLRGLAARSDLLICADGGADALLAAGLTPDLIVGDMDSIAAETHAVFAAAGVTFQTHPAAKDRTDLELAIHAALRHDPSELTIAGALGGRRFDHAVGNLLLLALPALRAVDARLVDATSETLVVWRRREIVGHAGDYISLLPLTSEVGGVRTEGLRYPLCGEALLQGQTRGVSNELTGTKAAIAVTDGCLLVVHEL